MPLANPDDLTTWAHWLHDALYDPACPPPVGAPPWEALAAVGFQEAFAGRRLMGVDAPLAVAQAARRTLALNVVRAAAFRRVAAALEAAQVPWMALKGAAILARFPDRIGQRRMVDYDLLVAPALRAKAQAVLAGQGLTRAKVAGPATSWWIAEESWLLVEGTVAIELDVHRGFHNAPLFPGLATAFLARRQQIGEVWVPDAADHLVHIALHRVRSATPPGHRELWDICLLVAANPGVVDRAWDRAGELGLSMALLALFAQVTAAFGAPPSWRVQHHAARPVSGWTPGPAADVILPAHATRWLEGRTPWWARPLVQRQPVLRKYGPLVDLTAEGRRIPVALGIHACLAGVDHARATAERWRRRWVLRAGGNSTTPSGPDSRP